MYQFLVILLIALYYINNNFKNIESFDGDPTIPAPTIYYPTDEPNTTQYNIRNQNYSGTARSIIGNDMSLQSIIDKNILDLSTILNKYKNIDVPIIINNNNICGDWGNYDNSISADSSTNLVTCSNYYSDESINNLNIINTDNILNTVKTKIYLDNQNVKNDIKNMSSNIYIVLDDLINKRNLENQQISFINYNINNINDKQHLVNESKYVFEQAENDVNINQIEFAKFLQDNRNHDSQFNIYHKITIGIIITIIIMGILNILFSNIL